MVLECVHPFGNFVPGDEIEVPDGDVFDVAYFKEVPLKAHKKPVKDETDG